MAQSGRPIKKLWKLKYKITTTQVPDHPWLLQMAHRLKHYSKGLENETDAGTSAHKKQKDGFESNQTDAC